MDGSHFDQFSRALTGSRRSMLGATLALAPGLLGFPTTAAKKKRKKRKPKAKPNEFGCLEVGGACKNADQCCSGVCEGKKGKRRCSAHDTGTCRQEGFGICSGSTGTPFKCNDSGNCVCFHTTSGSNFCADLANAGLDICADCQKDADCQGLGFPPGSACIPISEGGCDGICEGGMACFAPCGTPLPEG